MKEGNILWYDNKKGHGIIVDANGNEYYFEGSHVISHPELIKSDAFVFFKSKRLKPDNILVVVEAHILTAENDELYDHWLETQNVSLSDFVHQFVHMDYFKEKFEGKRLRGEVHEVRESAFKKGTKDMRIVFYDTKLPYQVHSYSEMVKSQNVSKGDVVTAKVMVYGLEGHIFLFDDVRRAND